jgi:hypothetical protein
VEDTTLSQDDDIHIWKLEDLVKLSSKSFHKTFFNFQTLLNLNLGKGYGNLNASKMQGFYLVGY